MGAGGAEPQTPLTLTTGRNLPMTARGRTETKSTAEGSVRCHLQSRSLSLSTSCRLAPSAAVVLNAVWFGPQLAVMERDATMSRQSSRSYT